MKHYICNCPEMFIYKKGETCPFCFIPKPKKINKRYIKRMEREDRDMQIMIKYITGKNMTKIAGELGISRRTVYRVVHFYKNRQLNG